MACITNNPNSKLFLPLLLLLFLLQNCVGSTKIPVSVNSQFLNTHNRVMSTKNSASTNSQFLNVHIRVTSTKNPTSINSQFLSAHNRVRARHNIPPLRWSAGLARYAKRYANARRGDCALIHSAGDYGENIFWGQGNSAWKAADAVAAWAVQEGYYDYKRNRCEMGKECLHYTQVVWRKTLKVGCARIKCGSGDAYVVCEYYPHGNVIGERPY